MVLVDPNNRSAARNRKKTGTDQLINLRNPVVSLEKMDFHQIAQIAYESKLVTLVIDRMLPLSFVDSNVFKEYTNCNAFYIFCSKFFLTLIDILSTVLSIGNASPAVDSYHLMSIDLIKSRITERFETRNRDQIEKLTKIEHVAINTTILSIENKRFMGMMVHWIDSNSFEPKFQVLYFQQLSSLYTVENLASIESCVMNHFGNQDKIVEMFTNKEIGFKSVFMELGTIFDVEKSGENPSLSISDSASRRIMNAYAICSQKQSASQKLYSLLSEDAAEALKIDSFANICRSSMRKLNNLFQSARQNGEIMRTNNVSIEPIVIKNWDSFYNVVQSVVKHDFDLMNKTLAGMNISEFTIEEFAFLKDFLRIIEPIIEALDNFQSNGLYGIIYLL